MYCGDETASFIADIGSHTCRFGYGGEDNPKMVVSSYVNVEHQTMVPSCLSSLTKKKKSNDDNPNNSSDDDIIQSILRRPQCTTKSVDSTDHGLMKPIVNPDEFLQQGEAIDNWNALEIAWHSGMNTLRAKDTLKHTKGGTPYTATTSGGTSSAPTTPTNASSSSTTTGAAAATTTIHASLATSTTIPSASNTAAMGDGKCVHPILAVTPGMTHCVGGDGSTTGTGTSTVGPKFGAALQRQQYVQYTELIMESLEATSMFLAPTPMLAAFSHGRQTALVVDVGAGGCRVTPVVDGLVLQHSQRRNGRGGDWLDHITWQALLDYKQQQQEATDTGTSPTTTSTTTTTLPTILPRYQIRQQRLGQHQKGHKDLIQTYYNSSLYHQWSMQDLMYELRSSSYCTLNPLDPTDDKEYRIPFTTATSTTSNDATMKTTSATSSPDKEATGDAKTDEDGDVAMTPAETTKETKSPEKEDDASASSSSSTRSSSSSSPSSDQLYVLPDGTQIDLSSSSSSAVTTTTTTTTTGPDKGRIFIRGEDFGRIPELLFAETLPFATTAAAGGSSNKPNPYPFHTLSNVPLQQLVYQSLLAVGDVDVRKELAGHIVVTGGTSVVPQLDVRLSSHVSNLIPTLACKQPKVLASRHMIERSCASWIGASILTSLGSFQQLWLSRTEYEEYGANLAIQRFP